MRETKRELRNRWSEQEATRVVDCLMTNRLEQLGRIEFEGKPFLDLRGLPINRSLHGFTLAFADLSYAQVINGQIAAKKLTDCRFIGIVVETNLGDLCGRCEFAEAKLKGAMLYGTFIECSFAQANLYYVRASHAKFERCNFQGADLRWAHLYDCTFVDCSFVGARFGEGSLAGSTFVGGDVRAVDLKNTLLERTSFS